MKKLARNTLALGTATLIVTAGLSFAANGADATRSYSTGRFLSGSIGGTNLDTLAQLRGVTAANPGNPGPTKNNVDVTVLSALPINIPGGLDLDVAKLLSPSAGAAGAVNQYAAAGSTSKALAASGAINDSGGVLAPAGGVPTDANISLLGGPLAGINNNLASVNLGLGAVSSSTAVDKGTPTRNYKIAGLNLQLGVPLLKGLVADLDTALDPVEAANDITLSPADLCSITGTTLNVASATLLDLIDNPILRDTIDLLLNPLVGEDITSVDLCENSSLVGQILAAVNATALADLIEVQVTGLSDLTTGMANFSSDGVSVDLTNGAIMLDLASILDAAGANLNNLPPNTDILTFITSDLISGKITKVLDGAIAEIVTKLGAVDIKVTVAGTEVPVSLDDLTGELVPPLVGALSTATDAVAQIGAPIDTLLADLVPDLKQLVALTGNNQSQSKTPTLNTGTVNAGNVSAAAVGDYYRTSALKIDVLSNVANLDVAASEAAVLAAPVVDNAAAAAADDSDAPADNAAAADDSDADAKGDADSRTDADGNVDANADTVADADAQADADVTTTLPSTGAPNLLPFWLLGIALLLFGAAVLVNEKRRLNQV